MEERRPVFRCTFRRTLPTPSLWSSFGLSNLNLRSSEVMAHSITDEAKITFTNEGDRDQAAVKAVIQFAKSSSRDLAEGLVKCLPQTKYSLQFVLTVLLGECTNYERRGVVRHGIRGGPTQMPKSISRWHSVTQMAILSAPSILAEMEKPVEC